MQAFSPFQGFFVLAAYAAFVSAVVYFFSRGIIYTKRQFFVVNREVNPGVAAFAIAAMWIWAPALFISAQKAYAQGWVGFFWFWVPNVLCLVLFAFFIERIRASMPEGYTGSDYMRVRHSTRVQNVYFAEFSILATCSFAVQLLAGGKVFATLSGMPFWLTTIFLAAIPLWYSLYSGQRGSVVSNALQMVVILIAGGILVPWAIAKGGGWGVVWNGIYGAKGTYESLFSGDGLYVSLTFGIPVTLGLLSGPFGDQSFWQQGNSVKQAGVRKAFIWAAPIFGVVPLGIALLGFLAAGMHMKTTDSQVINVQVIQELLPVWALIPFVWLLLSGLVSTLDSNMTAIASLAGHDLLERKKGEGGTTAFRKEEVVPYSRKAMLILVVAGIGIANIPGIEIVHLFLFYGTVRSATLLPTIITVIATVQKRHVSEWGMFWGVIASLAVGLPLSAIGNLGKIDIFIVGAAIFTTFTSGAVVLIATALGKR